MGIRGKMYCLIENYLMHRTQYVHYNGCDSSTKPIKYGVPQGSILGPLFFILFMNDFSRASEILFTLLFVDDTSVFIVGTEYTKLILEFIYGIIYQVPYKLMFLTRLLNV